MRTSSQVEAARVLRNREPLRAWNESNTESRYQGTLHPPSLYGSRSSLLIEVEGCARESGDANLNSGSEVELPHLFPNHPHFQ